MGDGEGQKFKKRPKTAKQASKTLNQITDPKIPIIKTGLEPYGTNKSSFAMPSDHEGVGTGYNTERNREVNYKIQQQESQKEQTKKAENEAKKKTTSLYKNEYVPPNLYTFKKSLSSYGDGVARYVLPDEILQDMPLCPFREEIIHYATQTGQSVSDVLKELETFFDGRLTYYEGATTPDTGALSIGTSAPKQHTLNAKRIEIGYGPDGKAYAMVDEETYKKVITGQFDTTWFESNAICLNRPEGAVVLGVGQLEKNGFFWHMKTMDPKDINYEFTGKFKYTREFYGQLARQSHYEQSEEFSQFSLKCGWMEKDKLSTLPLKIQTQIMMGKAVLTDGIGEEERQRMLKNIEANTSLFYSSINGAIKPHVLLFAARDDGTVYVADAQNNRRGKGRTKQEALKNLAGSGFAGAGLYYYFDKKANTAGTACEQIIAKPAPKEWWHQLLVKAENLAWAGFIPTPYTLGAAALGIVSGMVERQAEKSDRQFHCGQQSTLAGETAQFWADMLFLATMVSGGTLAAVGKATGYGVGAIRTINAVRVSDVITGHAAMGGTGVSVSAQMLKGMDTPNVNDANFGMQLDEDDMPKLENARDKAANSYWQYVAPVYQWSKNPDNYGPAQATDSQTANQCLDEWFKPVMGATMEQLPLSLSGDELIKEQVKLACTRGLWMQQNSNTVRAYGDFVGWTLPGTVKYILMHGGPQLEPDAKTFWNGIQALFDFQKAQQMEEEDLKNAKEKLLRQITNAPEDSFGLAAQYYMRRSTQYSTRDPRFLLEAKKHADGLRHLWMSGEITTSEIVSAARMELLLQNPPGNGSPNWGMKQKKK